MKNIKRYITIILLSAFMLCMCGCFRAKKLSEKEIETVLFSASELIPLLSIDTMPFEFDEYVGYLVIANKATEIRQVFQAFDSGKITALTIDDAFYESEHYEKIIGRVEMILEYAKDCIKNDLSFTQQFGPENITYLYRSLTEEELQQNPLVESMGWSNGSISIEYAKDLTFTIIRMRFGVVQKDYSSYALEFKAP